MTSFAHRHGHSEGAGVGLSNRTSGFERRPNKPVQLSYLPAWLLLHLGPGLPGASENRFKRQVCPRSFRRLHDFSTCESRRQRQENAPYQFVSCPIRQYAGYALVRSFKSGPVPCGL